VGTSLETNHLPRQKFILYKVPLKITFTLIGIFNLLCLPPALGAEIDDLKARVEASPDNLKLRQQLAEEYFEDGQFKDVINTLKPKSENVPRESLVLLAETYQALNDPMNENKILEQLTTNFPKYAMGFVMLGDFYYRSSVAKNDAKLLTESFSAFKTAIGLNAKERLAYEGLLKSYERSKNWYELRTLLGDMIAKFGKAPELLAKLCRRNTLDGYFVNARRACTDAILAAPKNTENFVYLALVENREGDLGRAEKILKKVTEKYPQSEFANSSYADFLIQQKNLPGAENHFRKACVANPNSFRAQFGLSQVSFELKHYDTALAAFKEACRISPHYAYKPLKRAVDMLRHRSEIKMENLFSNLIDQCVDNEDSSRMPASVQDDLKSPFYLENPKR
jgi:tetratricopeptide (TPR) repeat protein